MSTCLYRKKSSFGSSRNFSLKICLFRNMAAKSQKIEKKKNLFALGKKFFQQCVVNAKLMSSFQPRFYPSGSRVPFSFFLLYRYSDSIIPITRTPDNSNCFCIPLEPSLILSYKKHSLTRTPDNSNIRYLEPYFYPPSAIFFR